jgi:transposase-like protein
MSPFPCKCPKCSSENVRFDYKYDTISNGSRQMLLCRDCRVSFSETKNTFLQNIRTPISMIWKVLKSRTEGTSLNATCRIFDIAKNTLLSWERKFFSLYHTLLIYSMTHTFIQLVIEGDEFYTKVDKNVPAEQSSGWTIVLMDRASRFIWELSCGKKDRSLFENAIETLAELVVQTKDITLLTDGERRYGKILFEICHELLLTGKRGRPKKTLKKGVTVRVKNKGSQTHKKGRKKPKYQTTCPQHPETSNNISDKETHANHVEANNSAMRRKCSAYRRKTNTYAKSETGLQRILNVYWVIHNFLRVHFTTKEVPAVSLGLIESGLVLEELFSIQCM